MINELLTTYVECYVHMHESSICLLVPTIGLVHVFMILPSWGLIKKREMVDINERVHGDRVWVTRVRVRLVVK